MLSTPGPCGSRNQPPRLSLDEVWQELSASHSLSHAVNQRNALDPINVKADTASTYVDVDVSGYTSSSDSRAGWFDCSAGADDIELNTHWMDGYNKSQRHAVVTHEFGYSLKPDHGPETAVMDSCPACYNPNMNNLQSWDVNSDHSVWGTEHEPPPCSTAGRSCRRHRGGLWRVVGLRLAASG